MPPHWDDLSLVERIVSGDEDAAREFARVYSARFEHLARQAGVPWQDCQDVAQDIFLTAISQMQRGLYRGESSLGTWLEKIAGGKINEYWRLRAHDKPLVPIPSPEGKDRFDSRRTAVNEPELKLEIDEQLRLSVKEVLIELPSLYRAILLLNRSEGYTIAEISHALEMTKGQVGRKLYTAEEMFRRVMRGEAVRRRKAVDSPPLSRNRAGLRLTAAADDDQE